MKTMLLLLLTILSYLYLTGVNAEPVVDPVQQLRAATGSTQPLAVALLDALERQSEPDVKTSIQALMNHGDLDLVLAVLSDYRYFARQEAAIAVSEVKTQKVAQALLRRYKNLNYAPLGGAEDVLILKETASVVQAALEKVTGVKADNTLKLPQKAQFFETVIQAMPN